MHLVRHGATPSNLERPPRLQGRTVDHPMTAEGETQARKTSQYLAGFPIRAVYASPMLRARRTAELIAAPHGLKVETIDQLVEVDVGDWEGKAWDEIERDHPEQYARFMGDCGMHGYPGGENMTQVVERVAPVFMSLAQSHPGEQIVVVAHNVVNRSYLADLLGLAQRDSRRVPQDNCGVNLLRYRGGRMKALTVNAIGHLLRESP